MQVAGALDKGSSQLRRRERGLYFTLKEPETKETMRVRYKGLKPANFEDAISIVAIGRYDAASDGVRGRQAAGEVPEQVPGRRGRREDLRLRRRDAARAAMDFLAQLYLPGALALWCALLFALAVALGLRRCSLRGDERRARRFARRAYAFFALSIVLGVAVLLVLLLALRDFRIEYVFQYSGLDLPCHYQLAAFWAGQKGSFLIWLLWGALLGLPLRPHRRQATRRR